MMWPALKTQNQTTKIFRNGYTFQADPDSPFRRFGGGGGDTQVQSESTLTKEQRGVVSDIINWIQPQIGRPGPVYPGERLAEMDPRYQQIAESAMQDYADVDFGAGRERIYSPVFESQYGTTGMFPGQFQGWRPEGFAGLGISPSEGGLVQIPGAEPVPGETISREGNIFDPVYAYTQRMFEDVVAPQTMEQFAGMGAAGSGGAAAALARQGQNLALGMGAQLAPLELQHQQWQREMAAQRAAQMPGIAEEIGGWEQAMRQAPLDIERQKWTEAQPYQNPYLGMLPAILPYGRPYTENIASQEPAGLGYSMLTGMAPGIGLAMAPQIGAGLSGIGSMLAGI